MAKEIIFHNINFHTKFSLEYELFMNEKNILTQNRCCMNPLKWIEIYDKFVGLKKDAEKYFSFGFN